MGEATQRNRSRKASAFGKSSQELGRELTELLTLDTPVLQERWAVLFGSDPPPRLGRRMMISAIAYRLQERALGGLKPSTQRLLDRVAGGGSVGSERTPKLTAGAGTVLIREWRGVRHRVTVLDKDVVYRGRRYKSLSEVVRVITGTRWSGTLFFGLKSRSRETVNG